MTASLQNQAQVGRGSEGMKALRFQRAAEPTAHSLS